MEKWSEDQQARNLLKQIATICAQIDDDLRTIAERKHRLADAEACLHDHKRQLDALQHKTTTFYKNLGT
jgi:hypothetical protein